MWIQRLRKRLDPFASYELMGYEQQGALERAAKEIEQPVEDARLGGLRSGLKEKPLECVQSDHGEDA